MLNLFINSMLIENMVFAFFFGMCSYIAVSKSVKTAIGLGAAVTFVMLMTVPLNYLLNQYVLAPNALAEGVDLSFLSFILFIAVIAAFVQLVEMIVEKFSPSLYNQLGIFLPLIAVNCAIMGGSLFMQQRVGDTILNVGDSIVYGLGSGIGWWLYNEGENFSTIISTNCTNAAITAIKMMNERKLKSTPSTSAFGASTYSFKR